MDHFSLPLYISLFLPTWVISYNKKKLPKVPFDLPIVRINPPFPLNPTREEGLRCHTELDRAKQGQTWQRKSKHPSLKFFL